MRCCHSCGLFAAFKMAMKSRVLRLPINSDVIMSEQVHLLQETPGGKYLLSPRQRSTSKGIKCKGKCSNNIFGILKLFFAGVEAI